MMDTIAVNGVGLAVIGLVVMVMLSSYENFVSKINIKEAGKTLSWLGKLDAGSLKLKLSASIVAISAIHLLKNYMEFKPEASGAPETKLMWLLIVHLGFVLSALCMQLMDKMDRASKSKTHEN